MPRSTHLVVRPSCPEKASVRVVETLIDRRKTLLSGRLPMTSDAAITFFYFDEIISWPATNNG